MPFSDQAHAQAALDARSAQHERHVHAGPGAALDPRRQAGRRRLGGRGSACTPTPARCSRATCSSRSRASASTPTTSWPRRRPRAPWRRIAHRGKLPAGFPGIEVDDSKLALGALAAGWRAQFTLPLIAVTGSNGKTTVTQMIASILRAWQPRGHAGHARQFQQRHRPAADAAAPARASIASRVIELGMNHPGEIAYLARHRAARPWRWSTTPSASTRNSWPPWKRWRAKTARCFAALGRQRRGRVPRRRGVHAAVERNWRARAACMTFGDRAHADIVLAGAEWQGGHWQVSVKTPAGPLAYRLHIAGRHNVRNALAAVACALAAGVPLAAIAQGLEAFEPVKGRSRALGVTAGRPHHHLGRRHLQRQPRFGARRHRRAGRAARARACWCWATWARSATRARSSTPKSATTRGPSGIEQLFTLGDQSRGA